MTKPQYRVLTEQSQLAAKINLIRSLVSKLVNKTALATDPESIIARDTMYAMLRALGERVSVVIGDDGDTQPETIGQWMIEAHDKRGYVQDTEDTGKVTVYRERKP